MVHGLLTLPPCVFLTLSAYFDASSKYNLSRTCRTLEVMMNWSSVWKQTNAIITTLDSDKKTEFIIDRMPESTRKLVFRGCEKKMPLFPTEYFFEKLSNFKNLTVMVLEKVKVNTHKSIINMDLFPESLEELSIKGSNFGNHFSFFKCSRRRTKLRVLIADECHWLHDVTLLWLVSYPNLEIISLVKCLTKTQLTMFVTNSLLKKLKIIDLRLSNICAKNVIKCIGPCDDEPLLQVIYTQTNENNGTNQRYARIRNMKEPYNVLGVSTKAVSPRSVLYTDPCRKPILTEKTKFLHKAGLKKRKKANNQIIMFTKRKVKFL